MIGCGLINGFSCGFGWITKKYSSSTVLFDRDAARSSLRVEGSNGGVLRHVRLGEFA